MKKISREEYIQEIIDLMKSDGDDRLEHANKSDDNDIYDTVQEFVWKDPDTNWTVKQLGSFFGYLNYEDFDEAFKFANDYFKKKYNDEVEFPSFINDKAVLLFENYHSKKDSFPKISNMWFRLDDFFWEFFDEACLEYNGSDFDLEGYLSYVKNNSNKANKWFNENKRDYIFSWELKWIVYDLWLKRIRNRISYESSPEPYGTISKDGDPILLELENNYRYLINLLATKKEIDLSCLLWTVYTTYHYFRKLNGEFIIPKRSLCLFDCLIDLEQKLNINPRDYPYLEAPSKLYGRWYVTEVSTQLVYDLMTAIINNFPRYYYDKPLYLGCDLPNKYGSGIAANMITFESFISDLNYYELWYLNTLVDDDFNDVMSEASEDSIVNGGPGTLFLTEKIDIERDYEIIRERVNAYLQK